MIVYLDASALVKRYVEEPGSDAVEALLRDGIAVTSRFTHVEIASAICRRCRAGDLSVDARDGILATVDEDLGSLFLVELTAPVSAEAESLLRRYALRAGGAVQLASCLAVQRQMRSSLRFVAFDNVLCRVAESEGVRVQAV